MTIFVDHLIGHPILNITRAILKRSFIFLSLTSSLSQEKKDTVILAKHSRSDIEYVLPYISS